MMYDDDQMLMLSGIQHYMYCPRQWALIHIEQQWGENRLTAEGQLLHENVDNPAYRRCCRRLLIILLIVSVSTFSVITGNER